jgi:hypothetical protein
LVSTTADESTVEVALRLDAIATNSAYALLAELPAAAVLEANVRHADRAALYLRVADIERGAA